MGVGHITNWYHPDRDRDAHLVIWLALGQLMLASTIIPAIGARLAWSAALL